MSKLLKNLILYYFLVANLVGQNVSLTGEFLPYEIYYVGSIDLATGKSDVELFNFLISGPAGEQDYEPPITFNAEFLIKIKFPL